MRTEIEREYGPLPAFFEPAFANPKVLRGLWLQTRFAWVESSVPASFRLALLKRLAERSPTPWRSVAEEAERLPQTVTTTDRTWPAEGSLEYDELLALAVRLLVDGSEDHLRTRFQGLLGSRSYASLIALLTYLQTCRTFAEAHTDPDKRNGAISDPTPRPTFEVDRDGRIVSCSLVAAKTFGYQPADLTGMRFRELFADEQGHTFDGYIDEPRNGHRPPPWEQSFKLVGRRADGSTFDAVVTLTNRGSGKRMEQLIAVVEADQNARPSDHPLARLACRLGWEYMLIWRFEPDEGLLRCVVVHRLAGKPLPDVEARAGARIAPGDGHVGRTFATGVPEWKTHLAPTDASTLGSGAWLPAGSHREPAEVIELLSTTARPCDPTLLEVLSMVARGTGSVRDRDAEATDGDDAGRDVLAPIRLAFDAAPVGMALVSVEPGREGEITEVNTAMAIMSGRAERDLVGASIGDLTHPDDVDLDNDLEARLRAGDIPSYQVVKRFQRADGDVFWGELTVALIRADDETRRPLYVVVQIADISERKQVEEALHANRDRLASVFEESPAGMGLATLDGRWLQVNDALCQMVGYAEAALLDRRLADVIVPEEAESVERYLLELVTDQVLGYRLETRVIDADADVTWVELSVSLIHDYDGSPAYVFAELQDVSERKRLEDELARGVLVDALTGLPSRILLFDRLEQTRARLERNGIPFAVLFLSLDGLHEIAERLGHERSAGVMHEVAARLVEAVRPGDTVARYSDAEFVIVCEDVGGAAGADTIAARIAEFCDFDLRDGDEQIELAVTLGVTVAGDSSDLPATLIERADAAMRRASRSGVPYLEHSPSS